jgi:hypothetical protein
MKYMDYFWSRFFGFLWIISWFLAIWFSDFRNELLITGLFALILTWLVSKVI